MRKKRILWNTISTKMLILVAVIIATLTGAMLFINWRNQAQLQQELKRALFSQNQYFTQTIKRDLSRVKKRQQEIVKSEPLLRLTFLPNFLSSREIQYNVQWLMREMAILEDTSDFVKSAAIYVPGDEHAIFSSYPALFQLMPGLASRYEMTGDQAVSFFPLEDGYHFVMKYPEISSLSDIDYLIDLTLSNNDIQSTLNQAYMGKDGLLLLANDSFSWHVSNASWDAESNLSFPKFQDAVLKMDPQSGSIITLGRKNYLYYRESFDDFGLFLYMLYPEQSMLASLRIYQLWYWIAISLAATVLFILRWYLQRQVHRPMRTLLGAFADVQDGNLDVRLSYDGKDEFSYLYNSFNLTIARLQKSIQETYESKLYAKTAELKQLQSQINPHFLYNCLFTLYNMAQLEDTDSIMQLTQHLGEYYRFLYNVQDDLIPLHEDFQQTLNYMHIQMIRFGDRLSLECGEIPENWRDIAIPKLTFQPIVENIFVHSFKKTGGHIRIRFVEGEGWLHVLFEDDGSGMDAEVMQKLKEQLDVKSPEPFTLSGLLNVHRRLRLTFGGSSGIILDESALGGLLVIVNLYKESK